MSPRCLERGGRRDDQGNGCILGKVPRVFLAVAGGLKDLTYVKYSKGGKRNGNRTICSLIW